MYYKIECLLAIVVYHTCCIIYRERFFRGFGETLSSTMATIRQARNTMIAMEQES